jgi:hypothetical protein
MLPPQQERTCSSIEYDCPDDLVDIIPSPTLGPNELGTDEICCGVSFTLHWARFKIFLRIRSRASACTSLVILDVCTTCIHESRTRMV